MSRLKGKRERWTIEDIEMLKTAYSQFPLQIPQSLVDRHGKPGCYTKARVMALSHKLTGAPLHFSSWPETTKSYLAGIIDGEGTITITHHKYKRKTTSGITSRPVVAISNTSYLLLDYLKSLKIGGSSFDMRKGKEHWKQAFQWTLSSHLSVYTFLKQIIPYLVIKKEKAEEILDWIKQKHPYQTSILE